MTANGSGIADVNTEKFLNVKFENMLWSSIKHRCSGCGHFYADDEIKEVGIITDDDTYSELTMCPHCLKVDAFPTFKNLGSENGGKSLQDE
jgi:rubredoxin